MAPSKEDTEPERDASPPEEEDKDAPDPTTSAKRKRKRKRKKKDDDDDKEAAPAAPLPLSAAAPDSKTAEVDRTAFVEGIPFTCTAAAVKEFFVRHLSKDNTEDNNNNHDHDNNTNLIRDLRLPVWQDSGRLRGYGHVVFDTTATRDRALHLTGQYLQNRYLTVAPAAAPKTGSVATAVVDHANPSATLALHNLSYDAVEADITAVMTAFGALAGDGAVRVVRHSQTGRSKGFGYVTFATVADATRAVQAPLVICGRAVRADYDHGRVRGSFRTADRKLWHKEYNHPAHNNNKDNNNKRARSHTKEHPEE